MSKNALLKSEVILKRIQDALGDPSYDLEKRKDILKKAVELDVFNDKEREANLPCEYSVVKSYLWTSLKDQRVRDAIDRLVEEASRAYAVGTRLINGWVLENKEALRDAQYFKNTLQNDVFLRDCFRGSKARGDLHTALENSPIYQRFRESLPSLERAVQVAGTSTAWSQIVNYMNINYTTNLQLHVLTHMKTRVLSHLKRLAMGLPDATLVTVNRVTIVQWKEGKLPLTDLYKSFWEGNIESLPEAIRGSMNEMRCLLKDSDWKLVDSEEPKFEANFFQLHLFLQASVPKCQETVENIVKKKRKKTPKVDLTVVEVETEDKPVKIPYVPSKGFTATPIAKLGRFFVTIDTKIMDGMKNIIGGEGKSLQEALGLSAEAIDATKKKLRKESRRRLSNAIRAQGKSKRQKKSKCRKAKKTIEKKRMSRGLGRNYLKKGWKIRSILTDGVTLCSRYEKIKLSLLDTVQTKKKPSTQNVIKEASEKYKELSKQGPVRLIGVDPGRVNLFQSSELEVGSMRFTREHYRTVTKSRKIQNDLQEKKPETLRIIEANLSSINGYKSRSLEDYEKVLSDTLPFMGQFLDYYGNKEHAKMKMLCYRRKVKCLTQRWNKVINMGPRKAPLMIGYGAAKFASSGKGEVPVPTSGVAKALFKTLKSRGIPFSIVPIDEYKTSQMCSCCGCQLKSFYETNESGKRIQNRGLKLCYSELCKATKVNPVLRNRDHNAAENIRKVLESYIKTQKRPDYLRRPDPSKGCSKSILV